MTKLYNCFSLVSVLFVALAIFNASITHAKEDIPQWVKTIEAKGDLRLRYQLTEKDETGKTTPDRSRGRIRARLGISGKVTDDAQVFIGLASGGGDPRSTNQTLQDTFSTKAINLDYAYAKIKLTKQITFLGGKIVRKSIIWEPSDLLWDSDVNVEGGGLVLRTGPVFLKAGGFILDESKEDLTATPPKTHTADPLMYVVQPGVKIDSGNLHVKAAVTYYGFSSVQGRSLEHSAGSNTMTGGALRYDYDAISPALEIGLKNAAGEAVPYAALFAEYVKNADPSDENIGLLIGFKAGARKVVKAGQWQFKYLYRKLEKDAWLDTFPDSDFAGGKTGYKGHEVVVQVGLKKNVALGLDYYMTEELNSTTDKEEKILQVDLALKF
ncbi:MAG: putative porin [Nitrospiria bacterium]